MSIPVDETHAKLYRGVHRFENPHTGEVRFRYFKAYNKRGPAKAMLTRQGTPKFYYGLRHAWWDGQSWQEVTFNNDAERFPFVEAYLEEAIGWQRV